MEAKPRSSPWSDRPQVKKGTLAEALVRRHLEQRGLVVYEPVTDGAHPFDKLCSTSDKRSLVIAEVKAKPCRRFFPDTGINVRNWEDYKAIRAKHRLQVFIYFTDEDIGAIYGNTLSELEQPREIDHNGKTLTYPLIHAGIVYFPLAAMRLVDRLSDKESAALSMLSTRRDNYAEAKPTHNGLGIGPLFENGEHHAP